MGRALTVKPRWQRSGGGSTRIALTLLPIGPIDLGVVRDLAGAVSALGFRVTVASERAIPVGAYVPARRQHQAAALVELARQEAGDRVLAVTEADLYSDDLNFVFGLADSPGRAAVISLHRLRAGGDAHLFRERAAKEAIHELGHTMGLPHCSDPLCVMYFSNSLADTDRKATAPCPRCRSLGGFAPRR
jgi:archaemetzincin